MKKSTITFCLMFLLIIGTSLANRPEGGAVIISSLRYEPAPAEAGSYMDIWIKVENYGKEKVEGAIFVLDPEFPFSLDSNEEAERYIGNLNVGEEAVLEYRVRVSENAVDGYNTLKCRFSTDSKAWITHKFQILVKTHYTMLNTKEVLISPEEVAPGEIVEVSLLLQNMADSIIKDLRAEIKLTQRDVLASTVHYTELPFTPVDSTNVLMSKMLGPREQKVFTYRLRVDPDTEPKIYRIPLELTYSDESGENEYSEQGIIAIVVSKKPDIMFNLDRSEIYTQNSKGDITIGIYNIGMSKIKFSVVELLNNEGYEILSTSRLYLGNVDSDDYELANFKLYVKEENPQLNLKLEYKDEYNEEHEDYFSLDLKTYSSQEAIKYGFIQSNSGGIIILIIVLLGVGSWIYFKKIRKKKR